MNTPTDLETARGVGGDRVPGCSAVPPATGWTGGAPLAKIVCDSLSHSYLVGSRRRTEVHALADVTLTVAAGEFVCVIGPSGCGKSTLLNVMGGHIHPTAGSVLIDGEPVLGPTPDVGMVFQGFALFPWRTVQANVEFGPEARNVPRRERREIADRYIAMVGLTDFRHAYPRELSGGMRQRVAIARALANDPDVLLMDEPFGALDALTRDSLQEEIARIWQETRKTIVFVTHNIEEAIYLSDRVVVMATHPGRVQEIVPIELESGRTDKERRFSQRFLEYKAELWRLLEVGTP